MLSVKAIFMELEEEEINEIDGRNFGEEGEIQLFIPLASISKKR